MKIGDRVNTIDGMGVYLGDDCPLSKRSLRHKVKLDVDPYKYDSGIVCYWPKEMRPLDTNEGEQLRTTAVA